MDHSLFLACLCGLCLIYFANFLAEVEWVIFCSWLVYVACVAEVMWVILC